MTNRFDLERSVWRSGLSATHKVVLAALLSAVDNDTCVIPDQWSPSLTRLALATSLGRSTVARALNDLEELGWVLRSRPNVDDARRHGARTSYKLACPRPDLVPQRDQGSPTAGPDLVPQRDTSHSSTTQDHSHLGSGSPSELPTRASRSPETPDASRPWTLPYVKRVVVETVEQLTRHHAQGPRVLSDYEARTVARYVLQKVDGAGKPQSVVRAYLMSVDSQGNLGDFLPARSA